MRKKILSLMIMFFALFSVSLAQDSNIGDVSVRFCNGDTQTKNLSLVLEGGIEKNICMDFYNGSTSDVTIKYGFVDGVIAAGETPKKACKNEGEGESFGKYVSQEYSTITIPAGETVRQTASVKYPAGMSGMFNGCLTYYVSDKQQDIVDDDNMFSILVRRATFIDVLVGGELKRNIKLASNDPITKSFDRKTKTFTIDVALVNSGNVDENVIASGFVSNKFGYKNDIVLDTQKIVSDSNGIFEIQITDLPWYKMFYDVNLNLVSMPDILFDTSALDNSITDPVNISLSVRLFEFPWIILICVLGVVGLICLASFLSKHLKFQK